MGCFARHKCVQFPEDGTLVAFHIATRELAEQSQPGDQYYGTQNSSGGKVMIFASRIPLTRGETVVGAVGLSGGTGKQNQQIGEAAAAAFAAERDCAGDLACIILSIACTAILALSQRASA